MYQLRALLLVLAKIPLRRCSFRLRAQLSLLSFFVQLTLGLTAMAAMMKLSELVQKWCQV